MFVKVEGFLSRSGIQATRHEGRFMFNIYQKRQQEISLITVFADENLIEEAFDESGAEIKYKEDGSADLYGYIIEVEGYLRYDGEKEDGGDKMVMYTISAIRMSIRPFNRSNNGEGSNRKFGNKSSASDDYEGKFKKAKKIIESIEGTKKKKRW